MATITIAMRDIDNQIFDKAAWGSCFGKIDADCSVTVDFHLTKEMLRNAIGTLAIGCNIIAVHPTRNEFLWVDSNGVHYNSSFQLTMYGSRLYATVHVDPIDSWNVD